MGEQPKHFRGKEAIEHVAEAQAKGIVASTEMHGTELPGFLTAGSDAAKETAVILLMLWSFGFEQLPLYAIFGAGWLLWKFGRSAWLGWSRLERLHRVIGQEKWEIEHHRDQEKEELKELYAARGFEGKLLDDVVDVLMADGDRLLQVMIEEEMGLTLETLEHPLKQALGAAGGVLFTLLVILISFILIGPVGLIGASFVVLAIASGMAASYIENRVIPAMVWNVGNAILAFGSVYFLRELV